jgi:hypothetical protein
MQTARAGSAEGARRHGALLRRGMRCAQWLAKRQRERINILQPALFTI